MAIEYRKTVWFPSDWYVAKGVPLTPFGKPKSGMVLETKGRFIKVSVGNPEKYGHRTSWKRVPKSLVRETKREVVELIGSRK